MTFPLIDVREGLHQMGSGYTALQEVGDRLTLVGVIHVDPSDAAVVSDVILRLRPEAVALEIDQSRLYVLQNPKAAKLSTVPGVSFFAMVLLERFAGQLTGSAPGTEMLNAIEAARRVGARVELVDLPIQITIRGLRGLPLRERFRLLLDAIGSMVLLPFGKADLKSLASQVEDQLRLFRERYPVLSNLLLDSREKHMVNQIRELLAGTTGRVVAVVGLGHVARLGKLLAGYDGKRGFSATLSWTVSAVSHAS